MIMFLCWNKKNRIF